MLGLQGNKGAHDIGVQNSFGVKQLLVHKWGKTRFFLLF
jgi:hypothetical protein